MLHPVGPLPAAVYWRRRLLVLGCALGVLGGGGWVGTAVATRDAADPGTTEAASTASAAPAPALDQVAPALAALEVPTDVPAPVPAPASTPAPPPAPPAPVAGGPCTDDMIAVEVRPTPPTAAVGSKPTFDLVVTNVAPVPCVRPLDKGLQEVVLLDGAGTRVWGSNDCFPEVTSDLRTLQAGEAVVFPVLWGGLTSTPGCTEARSTPAAGNYVLRGRLDTRTSPDAPFTLT